MESVITALIFGVVFFLWLRSSRRPPTNSGGTKSSVATTSVEIADVDQDDGEQDYDAGSSFWGAPAEPAAGRYRIEYVDASGCKTERVIEVRSVQTVDGKHAILARCLLRGANRTFIEDRIVSAVNVDTGEVVASAAKDALKNYAGTDEGKVWAAIASESDAVAALIYVCRADGQMRKPERAVVAEYVLEKSPHMHVDAAALDDAIKQCHGPIGHRDFQALLKKMAESKGKAGMERLLDCAERIVGTQKTVHPQETAAIEMMRRIVQSR